MPHSRYSELYSRAEAELTSLNPGSGILWMFLSIIGLVAVILFIRTQKRSAALTVLLGAAGATLILLVVAAGVSVTQGLQRDTEANHALNRTVTSMLQEKYGDELTDVQLKARYDPATLDRAESYQIQFEVDGETHQGVYRVYLHPDNREPVVMSRDAQTSDEGSPSVTELESMAIR